MGIIIGSISSPGPNIPMGLRGVLQIRTLITLLPNECKVFSIALIAIDKQLKREKVDVKAKNVAVVFLDGHLMNYDIDDDCYGSHIEFVLYNMKKIRDYGFPDEKLLVIFLEELCHAMWNIRDEIMVKEKVTEVYNSYFKSQYKIQDLFSKEWLISNGCMLTAEDKKESL